MHSFEKVKTWVSELRKHLLIETPILIAGNKCDLKNRVVPYDLVEEYPLQAINSDFVDMQLVWEFNTYRWVLRQVKEYLICLLIWQKVIPSITHIYRNNNQSKEEMGWTKYEIENQH